MNAPLNIEQLTPEEALVIELAMQRESCIYFAAQNLMGPPEAPYNGRFIVGDHHLEWDELCRRDRVCVLAPRDHGKSFAWNKAFPIWKAAFGSVGEIGYIFSVNQDKANEMLQIVVEELTGNPKLAWLTPVDWERRWSKRRIRLTTGVEIRARGFGVKVRGGHPHWIVNDDILSDDNIYSETIRNKAIDYYLSAITNMIVPGGQIVTVGCVTGDTWVSTEKGLRRIRSLCPGPETPQALYDVELPVHGRSGVETASKFWVNGRCATKRVTLERGFRVEGSHRHPLLVMDADGIARWRRCDEIEVGDYVAVKPGCNAWASSEPRIPALPERKGGNPVDLPSTLTPDLAYLLGLWTAEGSFERTGRVMISNTEEQIRAYLAAYPFGMRFAENNTPGSEQTMRCSAIHFLDAIEACGGTLARCNGKTVPRLIMEGTKAAARAFLQGLFDGDGCAYVNGRTQQVSLVTTSEALARDVQILLLNFGIVAALDQQDPPPPTERAPHPNHDQWRVRMCAGEAFLYMREVGFRLPRKAATVADMRQDEPDRGIPHQGALIAQMRGEKPRIPRGTGTKAPTNIAALAQDDRPVRSRLEVAWRWLCRHGATGPATTAMRSNLDESFTWLKAESVEDGEAETFDFVVPRGASFIGNGLVNHNTPLHQADLYAHLRDSGRYAMWEKPALDPVTGDALWPARYSAKLLAERKQEIGSVRFTREFLVRPMSDDMSLFPSHLFAGEPFRQRNVKMGMPLAFWQALGIRCYIGVDIALSAETGADYLVIFVIGKDTSGNRWVVDIHREKGVPYARQLDLIVEYSRRYDAQLVFVEANQAQRVWGDELIRTTDIPIKKFTTIGKGKGTGSTMSQTANKNDLEKGVPSLRPLLENKKWRCPQGDAQSVEKARIWIAEMNAFSWINGKVQGVGSHDDVVMACVAPGHRVTTRRGLVPIEDVVTGDEVLTHRARWRRVTGVTNRAHDGEAIVLKPSGSLSVMVTPEHPVWATPARRDVRSNNCRVIPEAEAWSFRASGDLRVGHRVAGDFVLSPRAMWPSMEGRFDLGALVHNTDRTLRDGGPKWKVEADTVWWRSDRRMPRFLTIDDNFAFLVGLYLAEGSTNGHQIQLALHRRETYIAEFAAAQVDRLFAAPCSSHDVEEAGMVVTIGSVPGARFFKQFGSRAAKSLPWAWMGLPLRHRLQIVRGWFVGDGSLDGKGAARHLKGVSVSRDLIEQMRLTLVEAGYIPRVSTFSNPNPAWVLLLTASDTSRLLAEPNAVERARWSSRAPYAPKRTNVMAVPVEDGIALKLNGSERVPYHGLVYNMHVEEDESYVVEGIAVHNCWIAEQAVRRGGFSASFGNGEDEEDPRALAKRAARVAGLAEGHPADEDARVVAASTNPLGSAGNLGASDTTSDHGLWAAVPFYSR